MARLNLKLSLFFASLMCCTTFLTAPVGAQHMPTNSTDPNEIAAECGGTAGAGEAHFQTCATCHALTKDAPPMRGPHLEGVFQRRIASVAGYEYSAAMRLAGVNGAIWDRDRLHAYLADPAGHLPGTSMDMAGMTNEQERRDLMTYMRTASLAPPPARGTLVLEPEVLAMSGDLDYGEYLAGECLSCHLQDATASGIPNIYTLPSDAFVYAMHEYRVKARENPAMQMIAGALDDEAIASLASYFAAQKAVLNSH